MENSLKTRFITNEVVTEYINGFYKPLNARLSDLRKKSEQKGIPIILPEAETFLGVELAMIRPKRILEIGCAVGYSAMFFAECSGADIVTIEKDHAMYLSANENIEALGYKDKVTVYEGDGEAVINTLVANGEASFDVVFIDAGKSHYKRFLESALPLTHSGTVIFSDNVLFQAKTVSDEYDIGGKHKTNVKKLREYLDFISNDERFTTSICAIGDGISVSVVK